MSPTQNTLFTYTHTDSHTDTHHGRLPMQTNRQPGQETQRNNGNCYQHSHTKVQIPLARFHITSKRSYFKPNLNTTSAQYPNHVTPPPVAQMQGERQNTARGLRPKLPCYTLTGNNVKTHTCATQGARQIHSTAFYPSVGGKVWDTVTGKSG